MKITILDGNPEKNRKDYDRYVNELAAGLQAGKN